MPSTEAIDAAVRANDAWMRATLHRLVRVPSFSGREAAALAELRTVLLDLGFEVTDVVPEAGTLSGHRLYSPPLPHLTGCHSLLASLPGAGRGRSLLVNGHLDVVPTGAHELWAHPPFEPREEDGWLYGRGAGDMKGGIVAALTGIKALLDLGHQPGGPLWFNAVAEEESSGNGALASVEHLRAKGIRIDAMLDPEPFAESIMSGQVGVAWAQLTITGRPAHAMEAAAGLNAIEAGMHVWQALKALEVEWNPPYSRHPLFGDHPHPINFNLGRVEGGEWASSVPTGCRMEFRCGFYPDVDPADAKAAIAGRVAAAVAALPEPPRYELTFLGFHAPGCVVDLDAPPMRLLADCHRLVNGAAPASYAATGTTDVRLFQLGAGIPSTCYGPRARRIHALDECVELASMERVARVYAHFIDAWCIGAT